MTKKPKIAIITLHPHNYGGVLSAMLAAYDFCSIYFEPTLFFLGFDKKISATLRPLKLRSDVLKKVYFGMNSVEIGSRFAFWEPGHYRFTLPIWREQLEGYDYFFVVSGTSIAAHPPVLLKKRFLLWVASTYDADREQRVEKLRGARTIIDRIARPHMRKIEKEIVESADCILAMSRYTKKSLGVVAKNRNMQLCGYPVLVKTQDSSLKKEKILLAVGRFDDPRKNIEMLLEVFSKLSKHIPNLKLYIVGNAPRSLPHSSNIIFTGFIDERSKEALYKKASLLLITSYQEGLGIVGLEAFACGVPVISTRCGGPEDFVISGETGYLVDVNDVSEMVEKCLLLLRDDAAREKMSKEALELVKSRYSFESVHEIFRKVLVSVYPDLESLLTTPSLIAAKKESETLEDPGY